MKLLSDPPTLGDRWNSTEIYWLTADGTNVQAMSSRSVAPSNATNRTQAVEKGTWRQTTEYISRYAGPDGDHWFNAIMDIKVPVTVTANISATLPAAVCARTRRVKLDDESETIATATMKRRKNRAR